MVQATVAAHISAICAGALRYRDEIVAATTKPSPAAATTPETEVEVTPVPVLGAPLSSAVATAADGRGYLHKVPVGEALEHGGGIVGDDPGAGICSLTVGGNYGTGSDPAGHLQHTETYDEAHEYDVRATSDNNSGEPKEGSNGAGVGGTQEPEEVDACTPAAVTVSSSPSTAYVVAAFAAEASPPTATAGAAAAADDDDDSGQWWEEDEEDDEEEEEQQHVSLERVGNEDAGAGINKLWRGATAATSKTSKNGGGAGGETGSSRNSSSSTWIRRREREIPFLGLLVRSQVLQCCWGCWCPQQASVEFGKYDLEPENKFT